VGLIELQNQVIIEAIKLTEIGAVVTFTPSRGRTIESTVEKYGNREDRLPVDRWLNCNIAISRDKTGKVYETLEELNVYFDTGGCGGETTVQLDWELDWSFSRIAVSDDDIAHQVDKAA